jgi:hypothetical protein
MEGVMKCSMCQAENPDTKKFRHERYADGWVGNYEKELASIS